MVDSSSSDFTKDVSFPNRTFNPQNRSNQYKFQSPMVQNQGVKFDRGAHFFRKPNNLHNNNNQPNTSHYNNQPNASHYNNAVHNRLGPRNNFRNHDNFKNNRNDNFKNNGDNRNFNRKRLSDGNDGPSMPKRKWNNKKLNTSNNQAQQRLNNIRSQSQTNLNAPIKDSCGEGLNDSQEFDATDITVEVINHNAQPRDEPETFPARFKMVLDPKTQSAIKVIQMKRKDKQVIFPYPVTPNVTEITLHERFSML